MNTADDTTRPAVPTRLPVVAVNFESTGGAAIRIDGEPFKTATQVDRHTLGAVLRDVADGLGPVRVEVQETDGAVFTDILVPSMAPAVDIPTDAEATSVTQPDRSTEPGQGDFLPKEELYVAVVVADQRADAEGRAQLRLPPALRDRQNPIVILGRSSGSFTVCDQL